MIISFVALDVGQARIGIALANNVARIASPLPARANDAQFITYLQGLLTEHQVGTLVVGWPRNLNGQATDQTEYVEQFISKLSQQITVPIVRQDEALTSVKAEEELKQRGAPYQKGDIDSLSAVYILEDYLASEVH